MQLENEHGCPLDGFRKCRQLKCAWFAKITGHQVNDGKLVEEWACAIAWVPALALEIAGQARATGAAVESLRNEVVKANEDAKQQGPMIPFAPLLTSMMQQAPPLPNGSEPKRLEG